MREFEINWTWRTFAAFTYLFICIFDLVMMPVYREYTYSKIPVAQLVELSSRMKDPSSQIEALRLLRENRAWTPITNDMFHLSFGAILGVSALPSNRRRRQQPETTEE